MAGSVGTKMTQLAKSFPQGLTYSIPFDTTTFVRASINEVWKTLFEAAILVLIVIVIFLQDWRAMLVPMTTVPVTIIGAFAGMAALGFTVNLSTLFAIVLALGLVVDDAIVVVHGAAHHIARGLAPKGGHPGHERAVGPIIGITIVLIGISAGRLIPGLTGQMFTVRADRRDCIAECHQRRNVEADPVRVMAAPPVPPQRATGSFAASMRSIILERRIRG